MNLQNFDIQTSLEHISINFDRLDLKNLENLLNSNFNTLENVEYNLSHLQYLKHNWNNPNRDIFIQGTFGGYWDEEILEENQVTGNWCSYFTYEDLYSYINVDTQMIYIGDEYNPELPKVELSLEEFIDVLAQWKFFIQQNHML